MSYTIELRGGGPLDGEYIFLESEEVPPFYISRKIHAQMHNYKFNEDDFQYDYMGAIYSPSEEVPEDDEEPNIRDVE